MHSVGSRIGLGLIALGILLPLCSWLYLTTRNVTPLNESIQLQPGILRREFRVNLRSQYCVSLELQPVLPREAMHCMLGTGSFDKGIKCDKPPVLNLNWRVSQDEKQVGSGSSAKHDNLDQHDTIEANYGCVDLNRGKYVFELNQQGDAAALQVAKPRLQVYAYAFSERWVGFGVLFMFGIVLVCVGGIATIFWRVRNADL